MPSTVRGAGFLVAFSGKCRYLCPSCCAKRFLVWSERIEEEALDDVPHRQYVFTLPERLRPYFLHDRRFLGLLSRVACDPLREFLRASLGERDVVLAKALRRAVLAAFVRQGLPSPSDG